MLRDYSMIIEWMQRDGDYGDSSLTLNFSRLRA